MNSKTKKTTLSADQWRLVTALYRQALELSQDQRESYVDGETNDPWLRAEVKFLLGSAHALDNFLEEPIGARLAAVLTEPTPPTFPANYRMGDFFLKEVIGTGSFASVYLAHQNSLDREVAVKIAFDVGAASGAEARTMAHLEHDHIVKVFSESSQVAEDGRQLRVLCMQYIPGLSLDRIIGNLSKPVAGSEPTQDRGGAAILDWVDAHCPPNTLFNPGALKHRLYLQNLDFIEAVMWIGVRLADALAYAHSQGILHLDVKPSNILLSLYGRPLLTDFNVSLDARYMAKEGRGQLGGTFAYMPPEQQELFRAPDQEVALKSVDQRADIFALGRVLSELLESKQKAEPPSQKIKQRVQDTANQKELELVLKRSLEPNAADRFASASDFAHALESCLELRRVSKSMPRAGRLVGFTLKRPLVALTVIGAIPQMIASLVGIYYNSIRIVSHLSPEQTHLFLKLNSYYNPVLYTACFGIWIYQLSRLKPFLRNPEKFLGQPETVSQLRKHCLRLPIWGLVLSTLGWIPGSLIFPATLHYFAGPLSPAVFGHFLISFWLSWLIALAYSFLAHQFLSVRALYPRFWTGITDIRGKARHELAGIGRRSLLFYLTGLIPLIGAALLLFFGPEELDVSHYQDFKILVTCLIGAGMEGFLFAMQLGRQLDQTLFAFTGNEPHSSSQK